jgi:tRNA pseudouridine38-40 synthase
MMAEGRRIRLDLAYDGTDFSGWQRQPGQRTVQHVVETALSRIEGRDRVRARGAGRTDAGVHALGQVADARICTRLDDRALRSALGALFPGDLRPLAVTTAGDGFDACRDAVAKTYRYRLDRTPHGDPFVRRFALWHPHAMDRAALDDALARLPGRRDWAGFAGAASTARTTVRRLTEARYEEEPGAEAGVFTFTGDGFLNHMVRNLVGTLLDVARGRFGPERIDDVLTSRDRTRAGPTAPARGLWLVEVRYPWERGEPRTDGRPEDLRPGDAR